MKLLFICTHNRCCVCRIGQFRRSPARLAIAECVATRLWPPARAVEAAAGATAREPSRGRPRAAAAPRFPCLRRAARVGATHRSAGVGAAAGPAWNFVTTGVHELRGLSEPVELLLVDTDLR